MTTATREVWWRYPGSQPRLLARFVLDNGQVIAEFKDESFKVEVESGIPMMREGALCRFRPDDGAVFFEALDAAYSRSSTISVEELS